MVFSLLNSHYLNSYRLSIFLVKSMLYCLLFSLISFSK